MVGASRDRLLGIALTASILAAVPAAELRAAGFSPPPGAAVRPSTTPPTTPTTPPAAQPSAPAARPAPPSAGLAIPAAVDPEVPDHPSTATATLRATPRSEPAGKPRPPLYRRWVFWAVAGTLVLGAAAITYAAARPAPEPYYGNFTTQVIRLP